MFRSRGTRFGVAVVLATFGLLLAAVQPALALAPFNSGDVFAGIGGGQVVHYSPTGSVLDVLDTGTGVSDPPGNETGMCFDPLGNLYTTNYDGFSMTKFNNTGGVVSNPWGRTFSTPPESCTINAPGDGIYIGTGEIEPTLYKRDNAGNQTATYQLALDKWSVDWVDLASDGCTILYTSESDLVKRFNVCTNTQLSDFASGLPGPCFQVAIRSNGEVMVACDRQLVRLSSTGAILQRYDPNNERDWFTVALDPDGSSFWAAVYANGTIYKVGITSGSVLTSFPSLPHTGAGLAGLAVFKPAPPPTPYPRPGSGSPLRVALVPSYAKCTAPNTTHITPLNRPSCNPPVQQSSLLTTSSVGKGGGFVRLDVFCNGGASGEVPPCSTTAGDQADVNIAATATDVRKRSDGTDYVGKVILNAAMRVTDQSNGAGAFSGTVTDLQFGVPINCVGNTTSDLGSTCNLSTTTDTLVPGFAKEGKRMVVSALSVNLKDAGLDGSVGGAGCPPTCGTGDESVYMDQGVFAP
jgi:hypothetical protein